MAKSLQRERELQEESSLRWEARDRDIRALHARIARLEQDMKAGLDKKVDSKVYEVEIPALKDSVGKHECHQEATIAVMSSSMASIEKSVQNIEGSLNRWKAFKVGGVLAVVLAVISGAAYMINTNSKTEAVKTSVKRIETDVTDMRSQIKEIKPDQYAEARTLRTIREAIKEEMSRGK
jgi:outer membrane murein-binding lipoprotein Lpp